MRDSNEVESVSVVEHRRRRVAVAGERERAVARAERPRARPDAARDALERQPAVVDGDDARGAVVEDHRADVARRVPSDRRDCAFKLYRLPDAFVDARGAPERQMDAIAHERARAVGAERDGAAKIAVVEREGGHAVRLAPARVAPAVGGAVYLSHKTTARRRAGAMSNNTGCVDHSDVAVGLDAVVGDSVRRELAGVDDAATDVSHSDVQATVEHFPTQVTGHRSRVHV